MESPLLVSLLVALSAFTTLTAPDPGVRSRELAAQLVDTLSGRHLDAIAARDPGLENGYVAALFFPGSQLLVIDAAYPAPGYIEARLQAYAYKDVYAALQQAGTKDTRFFVQDLGADGLHAQDDQPVDIVYEKGVNQTVFDGNRDHKDHDYGKKLVAADARYSRVLQLLLDAARTGS
jgi:hypothetical protein